MDRDTARELFSDYLEGTIEPDQRQQLERYLATDDDTRRDLELFRKTLASLSSLQVQQPPTDFPRAVERRIRLRSRGRFFSERILTRLPFEWFSFIIIMLLLTLYLLLVIDIRKAKPTSDRPVDRVESPSTRGADPAPMRKSGRPRSP